jgi:spermidine synthase
MNWAKFFVPRDIFRTDSPYNHDIRVQTFMGKRNLMVAGSQQSGPYIERLWRAACAAFGVNKELKVRNILVLGIGGGTVIRLLHGLYPRAVIKAVDIDPVIVRIGRTYFGLGDIPNLTINVADAQTWKPRGKHDLIVIDLFTGAHIPEFVSSVIFLKRIRDMLAPGGHVVVNYLREKGYGAKSEILSERLMGLFDVRDYPVFRNRFFWLK